MSDWGRYDRCPTCGRFDYLGVHRCPPVHFVRAPDYDGEEWGAVYAQDAEEAAERYVERLDDDWDIASHGNELSVEVASDASGSDLRRFLVTGEMVPEYTAAEQSPEAEEVPNA